MSIRSIRLGYLCIEGIMKTVNSADLFLDGQLIGHSDKEDPS
jgi:hypothetical protein